MELTLIHLKPNAQLKHGKIRKISLVKLSPMSKQVDLGSAWGCAMDIFEASYFGEKRRKELSSHLHANIQVHYLTKLTYQRLILANSAH